MNPKGKVSIEEKGIDAPENLDDGIYVATFGKPNDRIIFVSNGRIALVLDELSNGEIGIQSGSNAKLYSNYKEVKKFNLDITL